MIAAPLARLQLAHQVEDLRLDGDVERGGRLVGDQQSRIAGQRHRDHHALAHAAGELVRIFVDAPLGRGDADAPQQLDGALARLRRRAAAMAQQHSMIWSPMVKLGLSDVIGSWKIIASRLPRRSRSVCVGSFSRSKPSKRIAPEISARCFGSSPMIASDVTLLPQPDSPTRPSVAPLRDAEIDAVDRVGACGRVAVEDDAQILDLDQRRLRS